MEEIKKVSVLLANYNKNACLPNMLYSLNEQETDFPVEICIIDDCSTEDPEPIFHKFLTKIPFKYKRLTIRSGTKKSMCKCLDLVDSETDVFICQSVDVLYGSNKLLQKMCSLLSPNSIVMPEVRNLTIPTELHTDWNIAPYLTEQAMDSEIFTNGDFLFYAGRRQPHPFKRWYMFLAAVAKEDLMRTCFPTNCFDRDVSASMHQLHFNCIYLNPIDDFVGIHQRHSRTGAGYLSNGLYDK